MGTDPDKAESLSFRYRLFEADGSEAGEAEYASEVYPGDSIWTLDGRELRVTRLVHVDQTSSPYTGLLGVEDEHGPLLD